jgi:hypothetical protein
MLKAMPELLRSLLGTALKLHINHLQCSQLRIGLALHNT